MTDGRAAREHRWRRRRRWIILFVSGATGALTAQLFPPPVFIALMVFVITAALVHIIAMEVYIRKVRRRLEEE